jgi:uncharacterized protein YndB with AHSA1/START domain
MAIEGTFRTSRFLPHPPAAVFGAFADPARLARWWGPAGFTNEFEAFDFSPGGGWRFVMIGPDGSRHPNENVFALIDAPSKVVIDHVSNPRFVLTVELNPEGSGTRVVWTQAFADPAVARAVKHIVEPANEDNLDRLGAVLAASPDAA